MPKSGPELFAEAKRNVKEISAHDAQALHGKRDGTIFLDVRDQPEVNLGKIPGALHISRGTLEGKVEAVVPRDANVVIYCASGNRSALAAETLQRMGYEHVASMAGGIRAWVDEGGDVE